MEMEKFLLKDSSGKKSVTMTAFVTGFVIVNLKLILSGVSLGDFSISEFTGTEYAAALGALGAIYVLRRTTSSNKEEQKNEEK